MRPTNSVLKTVKQIECLAFMLDSEQMVVKFTSEKVANIRMHCEKLLKTPSIVIRELAEIIGKRIACEHAMLST